MAQYIGDIVAYYSDLATNHPDLLHDEVAGNRVFEPVSYEEAFSDYKTAAQEKSFFLRFIMPTMSFKDKDNNARKEYQCGIMVGRYYSTREDVKSAKLQAFGEAERVADDIVARMIYDSRGGHALFSHSIDKIENLELTGDFVDVQGDGSYAAVMYIFNFNTFRCIDGAGSDFISVGWLDL